MNQEMKGTMNQISSSTFEWWSPFVCSLLVALFRDVPGIMQEDVERASSSERHALDDRVGRGQKRRD